MGKRFSSKRNAILTFNHPVSVGPWDVIVVGGGPTGCICATLLAANGWRVLLVEAGHHSRARLADMLSPTAFRHLPQHIREQLARSDCALNCRGIIAKWGKHPMRITDFELQPHGSGWILARPQSDAMLFEFASRAGACTRRGWRWINSVRGTNKGCWHIVFRTSQGTKIERARFVVDATGRNSGFRRGQRLFFDKQLAIAAMLGGTAADTSGMLWVESTCNGWWYLNAVPAGRAQLVFVTNSWPLRLRPNERLVFLANEFSRCRLLRDALGRKPAFQDLSIHDARLSLAVPDDEIGLLRAGDAAATTQPLSGRGWLRSIDSAEAAAAAASHVLASDDHTSVDIMRAATSRAFAEHATVQNEIEASLASDVGQGKELESKSPSNYN